MGSISAMRFYDSRAISLPVGGMIYEPHQEVNARTVFKLLDVSSNLLLFSVMPLNILVVKNPFHGSEQIIHLRAAHFNNESLTDPFHVHVTPWCIIKLLGFKLFM